MNVEIKQHQHSPDASPVYNFKSTRYDHLYTPSTADDVFFCLYEVVSRTNSI